MSREQPYFPPQGTAYRWESKALQYSPWVCLLSQQKEPDLWLFPLDVTLRVSLDDGKWRWYANMTDFHYVRTTLSGVEPDSLTACLTAERFGLEWLADRLPDWVRTALANKWRPPAG